MQLIEGLIFIRKGTKLPSQLRPSGNAIDGEWLMLSDDPSTLKEQVLVAGWHLFCLAELVPGWAIAWDKKLASVMALCKAMRKIARSRNAAEIVSIRHKQICGLYFCRVQLAVRHIQRDMFLPLAPAVALISLTVKPERWLSRPIKEQQPA